MTGHDRTATSERKGTPARVLTTRAVSEQEQQLAREWNIELSVCPLLVYRLVDPDPSDLQSLFRDPGDGWVFTSRNGVAGYLALAERRQWNHRIPPVFAIGQATAERLQGVTEQSVIAAGGTAVELADRIAEEQGVRQVVHFCGNRRRPELARRLDEHGIRVREVVVYRTEERDDVQAPEHPAGFVLFYSPSAVQAFVNRGLHRQLTAGNGKQPVAVAIGPTTRREAKQLLPYRVIKAESPSTESMLKQITRSEKAT